MFLRADAIWLGEVSGVPPPLGPEPQTYRYFPSWVSGSPCWGPEVSGQAAGPGSAFPAAWLWQEKVSVSRTQHTQKQMGWQAHGHTLKHMIVTGTMDLQTNRKAYNGSSVGTYAPTSSDLSQVIAPSIFALLSSSLAWWLLSMLLTGPARGPDPETSAGSPVVLKASISLFFMFSRTSDDKLSSLWLSLFMLRACVSPCPLCRKTFLSSYTCCLPFFPPFFCFFHLFSSTWPSVLSVSSHPVSLSSLSQFDVGIRLCWLSAEVCVLLSNSPAHPRRKIGRASCRERV